MNVLLDIMLSYRGILVLTMIVIFIVGMVYCRVVTGVGITNIFLSAPALSLPSGKSQRRQGTETASRQSLLCGASSPLLRGDSADRRFRKRNRYRGPGAANGEETHGEFGAGQYPFPDFSPGQPLFRA